MCASRCRTDKRWNEIGRKWSEEWSRVWWWSKPRIHKSSSEPDSSRHVEFPACWLPTLRNCRPTKRWSFHGLAFDEPDKSCRMDLINERISIEKLAHILGHCYEHSDEMRPGWTPFGVWPGTDKQWRWRTQAECCANCLDRNTPQSGWTCWICTDQIAPRSAGCCPIRRCDVGCTAVHVSSEVGRWKQISFSLNLWKNIKFLWKKRKDCPIHVQQIVQTRPTCKMAIAQAMALIE